jgi:hypothetical protein
MSSREEMAKKRDISAPKSWKMTDIIQKMRGKYTDNQQESQGQTPRPELVKMEQS